jgi:hypothetical protein
MEYVGLPRRDQPCSRCGWRYVGFHICFDASMPCPGEGRLTQTSKKAKKDKGRASEVQTERWATFREQHQERDIQIVSEYQGGTSLRDLAFKHNISHTTVIKIIKRAEEERGETIMRPRGLNYRHVKQKEISGGFQ